MTGRGQPGGPRQTVRFADAGEAADLAAFLGRLLYYDRGAAVRLQASGATLAVFGRPSSFEVLAIRTARLAKPDEDGLEATLDITVSAGELLESVDESAGAAALPDAVTGPPWAGVLPPRGGWRKEPGLPAPGALRAAVAAAVAEFRVRTEELAPQERTRAVFDRIGSEIWSRPLGDSALPVRVAHAAQALGFLRLPPSVARADAREAERAPQDARSTQDTQDAQATQDVRNVRHESALALLSAGAWLRLRTPYGSIAVRRGGGIGPLSVTPA